MPKCSCQHLNSDELVKERFHGICNDALQTIKGGDHIMHEEAAELLAFVGTDSEQVSIPGIPCHLPLAYALKGNSL